MQHAIDALIKDESTSTALCIILLEIGGMEVRQLPLGSTAEERQPAQTPRTCCFDAASEEETWTAQELCARCEAVKKLVQCE